MNARMKTRTGTVLGGRYKLLTPIAQGGMGEVWKARDSETGRLVAAKVLKTELFGEELPLSRLRIEAKNSMSIHHPNIANVQDSGEENGRGWIVMELVEGQPLTHYLKNGARIASEDLIPILTQVAMALGAAAEAGIVHRDIKPANIIVRPDGIVKLTDFGISRSHGQADLTAAGMVMGTAHYLPPEQAMGETATALGDLYALGVIAYEAVAGRRPFSGSTQVDIAFAHVNDPIPPLPSDVPAPMAELILHLLEKTPAKRPESGLALVRELAAVAQTMGVSVTAHPLPEPEGSEGGASSDGPVTTSQAPVRHMPRRTLPEEMLATPEALTRPGILPPPAILPAAKTRHETQPAPATLRAERPVSEAKSAPRIADGNMTRAAVSRSELTTQRLKTSSSRTPTPEENAQRRVALAQRLKKRAEDRSVHAPAPVRKAKPAKQIPWFSLSAANAKKATDTKAEVPVATKYNRSRVAPPLTAAQRAMRVLLFLVILICIIAAISFIIQNMLMSLTSILGEGRPVLEEVYTWQSPRAAV